MTTDGSSGSGRPQRFPRQEKERTLPIDRDVFAHRLWQAIKRSGLTYREAARLAQAHLPPGQRLSDVSVWSYAKGRSLPRRMAQIEALAKVLEVEVSDLVEETSSMRATRPSGSTGMTIVDLGDGRARIVADIEAPWPVAIEALRLLRGEDAAAAAGKEADDACRDDRSA
ncbi:hypothetical protein [Salinarimonas sp.]|uniref:hypothetical protein n=1 Tax=Salinarimonas sp. TaxID=2766526 RepID=UPI0032D9383C